MAEMNQRNERKTYAQLVTDFAPYEPGVVDMACLEAWLDQRRPCTLLIGCIGDECVIAQLGFGEEGSGYQARRMTRQSAQPVAEAIADCIKQREAFEAGRDDADGKPGVGRRALSVDEWGTKR